MQSLGARQSRYFANLIHSNLCAEAVNIIRRATDLIDFGCNMGDGTAVWHERWPDLQVTGLDVNDAALDTGRYRYRGVAFTSEMPAAVDVIVTSNVLEHFDDPNAFMAQHFATARKLYVVLVPWREENRVPGHHYTFTERDFVAPVGWRKLQHTILPPDSEFWGGEQILAAFGR